MQTLDQPMTRLPFTFFPFHPPIKEIAIGGLEGKGEREDEEEVRLNEM